jgi:hypothetical protein
VPGGSAINGCEIEIEIEQTRARLAANEVERRELEAVLRELLSRRPWENRKTAKSGYAPACANEWVRGICGKPQVKCGECPYLPMPRRK